MQKLKGGSKIKRLFQKLGINNKDDMFVFVIQFMRFAIVGLFNTFLSLFIYYAFVYFDEDLYLWGNVCGFLISVLSAFYLGNRFVFKSENNTWANWLKRLGKSYLTYGSTFLLSTAMLYIEVEILSISQWLAPLINLVMTVPLNFFINKYWTFNDK